MVGRVEKMGKEAFFLFDESEGFGEGGQRHLEKAERVFEHNVSSIDGQRQDLGSIDDLVGDDVLFVELVQDQVGIEALGVVREDGELTILRQFPQPIENVDDAGGAFEMKEFVAIGGGGTDQIGDVDPRVMHGLAVPVDEQFVLRVARHRAVRFAFWEAQAFSFFFQFAAILDEALVLVEIVILAAGRTFGGTADKTFLS